MASRLGERFRISSLEKTFSLAISHKIDNFTFPDCENAVNNPD